MPSAAHFGVMIMHITVHFSLTIRESIPDFQSVIATERSPWSI